MIYALHSFIFKQGLTVYPKKSLEEKSGAEKWNEYRVSNEEKTIELVVYVS